MDSMMQKKAKQQVITAGKEVSRSGLIARTWGNVSCRTGMDSFVITASGRDYQTLTEEEIIEIKISTLSYQGDIKPSSEKKVHREVYRLKPEVGFVIHTHQNNASAVSAMGLSEVVFDRSYPGIGNKVICADYGLPGTKKLCRNTAKAVEESNGNAVIMRHHGAVCYGRDYQEAFQVALELEKACGAYLAARGVESWQLPELKTAEEDWDTGQMQEEQEIWNTSPVVRNFPCKQKRLRPYLDDFAQLVGTKLKVVEASSGQLQQALEQGIPVLVENKGAFCGKKGQPDAEAVSMVIEKNCRAFFAAQAAALEKSGNRPAPPIKSWECSLMRQVYQKKYSKLNQKSENA